VIKEIARSKWKVFLFDANLLESRKMEIVLIKSVHWESAGELKRKYALEFTIKGKYISVKAASLPVWI